MSSASNTKSFASSSLAAMLLLSLTLLALNCLRAYSCGIEIDEADTYLLHLRNGLLDTLLMNPKAMAAYEFGMFDKWGSNWQYVLAANNHVLNTLAARIMVALAGSSELSLRLPNLLAHLVYLCSSFYICRSSSKNFYGFLMFALLNTNPFILGWFALCRGYGLALGFEMLALAFLFAYVRTGATPPARSWQLQFGACLAAALAALSNLTFSHFYMAMLIILLTIGFYRTKKQQAHKTGPFFQKHLLPLLSENWPIILVAGITAPLFTMQITRMANAENWAVQAGDRFIYTVYSLCEKSLTPHDSGMPPELLVWTLVVTALAALAVAMTFIVRQTLLSRADSACHWALAILGILVLCIAAQVAQHLLLQRPYWMERLALYFIPIYLLVIAELIRFVSVYEHALFKRLVLSAAVLLVTLFSAAFANSYSLKRIYFDEDQNIREVLNELSIQEKYRPDRSSFIILGATPESDRCLEFYRQTLNISWLAPVIRNQPPEKAHFYLVRENGNLETLQRYGYKKIKEFFAPRSVLLKNPYLD